MTLDNFTIIQTAMQIAVALEKRFQLMDPGQDATLLIKASQSIRRLAYRLDRQACDAFQSDRYKPRSIPHHQI